MSATLEPQPVSKEEVKMLAIQVGVRQAARELGLSEERVMKWSQRDNWLKQPDPVPLPPTITNSLVRTVRKPSEVLTTRLAEDSQASKSSLSQGIRKAAEYIGAQHGSKLFLKAKNVKETVGAASQLHGWEKKEEGSQTLVNVNILNQL